jgi:HK97 family phage portal protein
VFRLGRQIQDYASGTFRSGVPAGYLKVSTPDMSQDKADKLKANWLRNHGGDRRSIAVLNATTEFVPLNLSPVDAELAQVERLNIAEVAYAFALDPNTLGVTLASAMTYTNLRDAWLNHRDFGLGPWIAAVQDTLTALVPAGQSVTVDLDGFANPTRQDRYTAYKTGIDAGIITVDEVRQWEGLPPKPAAATSTIPPQLVPFTGQDEQDPEDDQENDDQEQAS